MNDKLKAELHKIALKNLVRDEVAKKIVNIPYEFMKNIIEELDLDELEKTNFYHKGLGRFYLKEEVLKKLKKNGNKSSKKKH